MNKKCSICKVTKSIQEFNKHARKKDGLQPQCKKCSRNQSKKYYKTHTEEHRKNIATRRVEKYNAFKSWIETIKLEYGCSLCGEKEPVCLDFHHLFNKQIEISTLASRQWSWDRVEAEIEKCVVVCANCHRKIHGGLIKVNTDRICHITGTSLQYPR